jgi:isoleucyl-tRNA synthetase
VAAVRADGAAVIALPDGELSLVEEELLIETGSPDGYQVEAAAGRVVALKTEIDDELREEGLARELIHAVQLARKAADLRIEDTISLTLAVPEQLRPPAERHRGTIMAETLASEFLLGDAAGDHRETAKVNGHEVGIGLSVTGTIFTVTYG